MEDNPSIGDYYLLRTIGLGSQAKVKLGQHKTTGMKVAIKVIKKKQFETKPDLEIKIQREISLMRILDHPHLLKLIDVYETETHLYLVLENAAHGELYDYLAEQGSIPASLALKFFRQIIYGLEFLHVHSICHRDMKPENVLLDENDNVKVGDFGFARWMKSNTADTSCGSPHYAAPEVIQGDAYDGRAADIWSVGVIFYVLLCGRLPFEDVSVRNLLIKIKTADFKMPDFPDPVKDIIARMLCVDVQQRITIEQIKRHPAFRLLMPEDYIYPTPLPPPIVCDPIDPSIISEQIIEVLHQIGFSDEELHVELTSNESTKAKAFCFMMARRMSFDCLPWGGKDACVSLNLKPGEIITICDPFFSKGTDDETAPPQPTENLENFPSSCFSIGFRIPCFATQVIHGVNARHESVMIATQKFLTDGGFNWFYPHDQLILARRQSDGTDILIEIEFEGNEKLSIIVRLASGDSLCFSPLVEALSRRVEMV